MIQAVLDKYAIDSPAATEAQAAVLIVLRAVGAKLETLLIERSVRAGDPASGQIGLPGGRVDGHDDRLRDTALRELTEEVGLGESDLTGPPRFISVEDAPRFGIRVGVFVAGLSETHRGPPVPSPDEVASIFWLPLDHLDSTRLVVRDTPAGAREVEAVLYGGHVLWGFTLRVLRQFRKENPGS
ncbi:MAG TPA: CoA pyrophosphatase [Thermoplasmata archaeon]|nr:CoA pyrophosphatase [Thermoplasmata archaeon]